MHPQLRLALVASALALIVVGAAAQAPQQPPVFRSAVQFVTVDAVVTGKDDVPVTDLAKDDFEITENGKPQKISDFAFVSVPLANRSIDVDQPPGPPSDVASNALSASASRAIVILVDDSSLSAVLFCQDCPDVMVALKNALTQFLRSLSSNDQVAIIWQSRSDLGADFTNDIPRLIASVNSRKAAMGLTPLGPAWRPRTESLKSAVAALGGSHVARRAIIFVGVAACSAADTTSFQGIECQDLYRKSREANVPIYTLDPRVSPPPGLYNSLHELAINTGGRAFTNQSKPTWAVDQILIDDGSFYTLGFYPEPLVNDGKYHDIKVTVKRPGLHVRSREKYLADTATKPASTPTRDMTAALGAGLDDPSLAIRAFAAPIAPTQRGTTRTLVIIELAYPVPEGGTAALNDELRVGLLALTPDSKIKASFQRPITFTGTWKPTARGTFVINETIDLPDEQLTLRVGVTSRALGKTGTTHIPLDVPNFRDTDLTVSPIVVGSSTSALDAATGLDILRELVPFQPVTTRVFARSDTLRVFARTYWGNSSTTADATVTMAGRGPGLQMKTPITAEIQGPGRRRGAVDVRMPLDTLAPGPYVLRIDIALPKGKSVRREIPIEVR